MFYTKWIPTKDFNFMLYSRTGFPEKYWPRDGTSITKNIFNWRCMHHIIRCTHYFTHIQTNTAHTHINPTNRGAAFFCSYNKWINYNFTRQYVTRNVRDAYEHILTFFSRVHFNNIITRCFIGIYFILLRNDNNN